MLKANQTMLVNAVYSTSKIAAFFLHLIIISVSSLTSSGKQNRDFGNETILFSTPHNNTTTSYLRHLLARNVVEAKIVGGNGASIGEYPSFAYKGGCGGTLIRHDIVLSAAHCRYWIWPQRFSWQIGGIRLDGKDSEIIGIAKEISHPNYNPITRNNDIMISKLACSSKNPIQKLNYNPAVPKPGDAVVAIGFGQTNAYIPIIPQFLQEVTVNVVSYKDCQQQLIDDYVIYEKTMLCAGVPEGGKDSCDADSGGPLLLSSDGSQVGITSMGVYCGLPNTPGVYVKVSNYQSWIEDMIKKHSAPTPKYC